MRALRPASVLGRAAARHPARQAAAALREPLGGVRALQPQPHVSAPGRLGAVAGRGWSRGAASKAADEDEPSYATGDLSGYKVFHLEEPYELSTGGVLPELKIAYETWGELNANKDNAILLQCGMSASSHAASHAGNPAKGWWEDFIGDGKPLDTRIFYVICTNNLGGCYGTTGPSSIDPRDGKHYGSRFPRFEVYDQVAAQFRLLDHLGIKSLHAAVGSSLGGMQSVCAAARFPDRVRKFVSISACAKSFPGSMAFRHAQRTAIMQDPNWNNGDYYDKQLPANGLRLARELGTITYRSGQEWQDRFGQNRFDGARAEADKGLDHEFEIERYLSHQGKKWVNNYDPNSMLWISKAMDGFSMELPGPDGKPCLKTGLSTAKQPALVIGVQFDVLFPVWQQKEIADTLRSIGNKSVCYYELDSTFGHDSFLLQMNSIGPAVKGHLEQEPGGAKHLWEDKAQIVHDVLVTITKQTNVPDVMRSIFRSLAKGSSTVDRDQLRYALKLLLAEDGLHDDRLDTVFEKQFPTRDVTIEEFVAARGAVLAGRTQGQLDTYLP